MAVGPLGEMLQQSPSCCVGGAASEPARELFEACRNGDVERVKRLVRPENVNGRDTAGRKSSPLHFAAGNQPWRSRTLPPPPPALSPSGAPG